MARAWLATIAVGCVGCFGPVDGDPDAVGDGDAAVDPAPADVPSTDRPTDPDDQVVPLPVAGLPTLPLLHPPFAGMARASNPFDHRPTPDAPSPLEVLDWRGVPVAGTRGHRGWDWAVPLGTPLLALADGVVTQAGPVPPFRCEVLGRDVSEQLAVNVQHVSPQGVVIETSMHHLSRVDVQVGEQVHRGQVVGLSGNSGCSLGPHVHLDTYAVLPRSKRLVDPFGWLGGGPDPWAESPTGAASIWLWDKAPPVWFLATSPPDAADKQRPVYLSAIRYEGWRDDAHLNNEYVELARDARFGPAGAFDLGGWSVEWPDGMRTALPDDAETSTDQPLRLYAGTGSDRSGVVRVGASGPLLPDSGGMVRLLDASGTEVDRLVYGLSDAPRQQPPPDERPACSSRTEGCVPLPVDGDVRHPVWSPDGHRLAVVVGSTARPVIVDVDAGWARAARGAGTLDITEAGAPGWLGDDILAFDAPRLPAAHTVWTGVPGLVASPALPLGFGTDVRVADAHAGMMVLTRFTARASGLFVWRVGDPEPQPITRLVTPTVAPRLAPDGREVIFLRDERLMRSQLQVGDEAWVARADPEAHQVGWLGADPAWYDDGTVRRLTDDGEVLVLEDVLPVVGFARDGSAMAALSSSGFVVMDDQRVGVGTVQPHGTPTSVDLVRHGAGWRLAYTATAPNGRSALYVASVP